MAELTSKESLPDCIFGKASSNKGKSDGAMSAGTSPPNQCPQCGSTSLYRDGLRYLADGSSIQRWFCRTCAYRFSEKPSQKNSKWSINTQTALVSNCQIGATDKEAKNLDLATETKTVAGEERQSAKGKLLEFAFHLKLQGYSEVTIDDWSYKLDRLAKNSDLDNPESVKKYLAFRDWAQSTKHSICVAYTAFLKWQGKTWTAPKYVGIQKIPEFIPTEQEIDALIAGCGKKTAVILQTLKETGMRIGECLSLTWTSINFEAHTITLNTPEKHSLPRIFKVSTKLTGMLQTMPKQSDRIFPNSRRAATTNLWRQRKTIATKLANPRIAKIHFHLIRHWYGTMEYHKRQDLVTVQRLLGHKSILNTQLYVNLEQAIFEANDQYNVKLASNIDEACKLLEVGFEYVTEMDGKKLFRKRK
jgi:integrase